MPVIVRQYDSVADTLAASQRLGRDGESSRRDDDGWAGGSWDNAVRMASEGWSDARPQVDAVLEPVRHQLAELLSYQLQPVFDLVGGGGIDMDRYLLGEIECMYEDMPQEIMKEGKVFTLLINGVYDSGVRPETILARGAAIAALVEAMSMMGCELSIYVECSVSPLSYGRRGKLPEGPNTWSLLTKVHAAGDLLDINNVMFAMGHPSWLRRICFGIMEGEKAQIRSTYGFGTGGYGRPSSTTLCNDVLPMKPSFVMQMGGSQYGQDISDPVGWVLSQLELQGIYTPSE